ncbi:hypothetical protein GCM10027341_30340 [Spirosoma knui]
MKTHSLILTFALLTLALSSCDPERVKYTNELKQQMADMKIKRITNADMVETVNTFGDRISRTVQNELAEKLQAATDPAEQAKLCQLQTLPRTKAIGEKYGVDIRLLGAADVQNKTLNQKEREILDAYLYNAEQKKSQISNIQKINDTLFIYNAVVPTENRICEVCFGKQKTPLAVWRIAFPKREVIRRTKPSAK